MKTTARQAYGAMVENRMKFEKRGYGERVMFINECPDCLGRGEGCPSCGNEPDSPENLVNVRGKWYRKLSDQ